LKSRCVPLQFRGPIIMTSPLDQKIKITGPVVVTANRVGDGAVVYWLADGGWTTDLGAATVTAEAKTADALVKAAIADDLHAVGSYIAPVKLTRDGEIRPGNLRERIRWSGPTIEMPVAGIKSAIAERDHAPQLSS
jgi:hypothetical protein